MAHRIFLLVASFHIPPTTLPPSLPLSPPISRPCAPCLFIRSTRHTDVSLIQATGKARKWILPFFQRVVEYASCSATAGLKGARWKPTGTVWHVLFSPSLHVDLFIATLKAWLQEVSSLALSCFLKEIAGLWICMWAAEEIQAGGHLTELSKNFYLFLNTVYCILLDSVSLESAVNACLFHTSWWRNARM